jgi:hypothetical protein
VLVTGSVIAQSNIGEKEMLEKKESSSVAHKSAIGFFLVSVCILVLLAVVFHYKVQRYSEVNNLGAVYVENSGGFFGERYTNKGFKSLYEDEIYLGKGNGALVYGFPNDPNHNFLYVYNGNAYHYIKDSYIQPSDSKIKLIITSNDQKITNTAILDLVDNLMERAEAIESTELYDSESGADGVDLFAAYTDCPVATHWVGSIVYSDGKLKFYLNESEADDESEYYQDRPSADVKFIEITDKKSIDLITNAEALCPPSYSEASL